MAATYPASTSPDYSSKDETMKLEILEGLSAQPKRIPCKYLYDERGSNLFQAITRQPEYYPTRAEVSILLRCSASVAAAAGTGVTLIEFGSGDNEKAHLLLAGLEAPHAYVALDIDPAALSRGLGRMRRRWPHLSVSGYPVDFTALDALPSHIPRHRRIGFFPGSTIGNFDPFEACNLLRRFRSLLGAGSGLVIGADLQKPVAPLLRAYDDAAGYTAAFNLNLLERCNRELKANFDVAAFDHEARFIAERSRVEMHLVSRAAQSVRIDDRDINFAAGESIHTESCHKYHVEEFALLARTGGWEPQQVWLDRDKLFSVHFLRAA